MISFNNIPKFEHYRRTIYSGICNSCNKWFHTFYKSRITCSKKCSNIIKKTGKFSVCKICSNKIWFIPAENNKFCSKKCYGQSRRKGTSIHCPNCKKIFYIQKWKQKQHAVNNFCSIRCHHAFYKGRQHWNWKGGHIRPRDGYKVIKIGDKQIPEHRLVMEKYLRRPLKKDESIHHKNGIRHDNRIDNLELWCIPRQRNGQRVKDLIKYVCENYRTETIHRLKHG